MKPEWKLYFMRAGRFFYQSVTFLVFGVFILVSCNGKVDTIVDNPPISTGTMPITKDGPISELTIQEVTEQIRNEARSLSVEDIREMPFGKEIVTKEGILKKRVSLGKVVRLYSLNDNNVSLDDFEHPPLRNNMQRVLMANSMIRDSSDYYMTTVSVAGIGTIGYVLVPVYSVYRGLREINWISYKDIQPINKSSISTQSKTSRMQLGELNSKLLQSALPYAVVDSHIYYFTDSQARDQLVRIVKSERKTYLFSEVDGTWYSVEKLEGSKLISQKNDKFGFLLGNEKVSIKEIETVQ